MAIVRRALYTMLGTFDFAAEKVRGLPAVEKIRETSLLEQVREIEPKVRKRADELQTRGEKVFRQARSRTDVVLDRVTSLRGDASEQLAGLRSRVARRDGSAARGRRRVSSVKAS